MTSPLEPTAEALRAELAELSSVYAVGLKNKISIAGHNHYGPRIRASLARLRTALDDLDEILSESRSQRLREARSSLTPTLKVLLEGPPSGIAARLKASKVGLDLVQHELNEALLQERKAAVTASAPDFVDPAILGEQLPLHRKILAEANVCYRQHCYNATAVLLRRVAEALIIKAFLAKGFGVKITDSVGEYLVLGALISRAQDKSTLGLSRNARTALPRLKFLGDVGAHSSGVLVKKSDLEKAELDIRATFEELASLL
jgi:hypothetical protein